MRVPRVRNGRLLALLMLAASFWFSRGGVVDAACHSGGGGGDTYFCCNGSSAGYYVGGEYGYEMCEIEQSEIDQYCSTACSECGLTYDGAHHGACTPEDESDDGSIECDCGEPI